MSGLYLVMLKKARVKIVRAATRIFEDTVHLTGLSAERRPKAAAEEGLKEEIDVMLCLQSVIHGIQCHLLVVWKSVNADVGCYKVDTLL